MIESLKRKWQRFKDGEPGDRFQAQHREGGSRKRSPVMRVLRATLGAIVTLVGLILMPAPGPGMLIVALGLVLVAHESLMVARLLDATELRVRPRVLKLLRWWRDRRRR